MRLQESKREIIRCGRRLYRRFLVTGRSGNLSLLLDSRRMLITAGTTCLGDLRPSDLVICGVDGAVPAGSRRPSSELPLHSRIYRENRCTHILHCHPPLTNAYFAAYPRLKELIHETRFCLGEIPVIPQQTVNVEDPRPVVRALGQSRLAVLKNHGVVAIGDSFEDPLYLVETLETAVYIAASARLFRADILDGLNRALRRGLAGRRLR